MKKKIIITITIIVLILLGAFIFKIGINKKNQYAKSDFVLDNENKYVITTTMKWKTVRDDGGSHINVYYQIDFDKNIIIKCEDSYVGFKGYEYQGKILYEKQLQELEKNELKTIIDNAISNTDKQEELNSDFYEISSLGKETVRVYDKDIFNKIKNILENKN